MKGHALSEFYQTCAIRKPEPRQRAKDRDKRVQADHVGEVREYVFGRERDFCRCCRLRSAESMHEIVPKSLRGKVSRKNSIAVCGSGTTGCHGYLQRNQIEVHPYRAANAETTITFIAWSPQAAEWLHVARGQAIESPVMQTTERAE